MSTDSLNQSPLGKAVAYNAHYDPKLLFSLPRATQREQLQLPTQWYGQDVWNAYELSWLGPNGCPQVALARFTLPHDSPCLIESKSLKLYLNSFNETQFDDWQEVQRTLEKDLSATAQSSVQVQLFTVDVAPSAQITPLQGIRIDDAPFEQRLSHPIPTHLRCTDETVENETLVSHLLKSNCLITQQPDWGSLLIRYSGPKIDRGRLLEYIVSYRSHNEFHEHCVERIFCDLLNQCNPQTLHVQALYTRRGGLDINPWRSTENRAPIPLRSTRQ
ncbi:MAG TPA: NADPH-dependent 7-cyano-7-deazaguanine reductase QueF [Paenalcaligenes sp.]|nr:NADPH-dependent 7-cyano-7-deazaguanine reductase QueF [Paenalcaligenes sp.]